MVATVDLSVTSELDYNGSNPSPFIYDVVLHLNGSSNGSMTVSGQQTLVQFVQNGGGYIGTEWLAYQESAYTTMLDLILLESTGTSISPSVWDVSSGMSNHLHLAYIARPSLSIDLAGHSLGSIRVFNTDPSRR